MHDLGGGASSISPNADWLELVGRDTPTNRDGLLSTSPMVPARLNVVYTLMQIASCAHVFYSAIGGKDGPGVGFSDVSNSLVWGPAQWNEVGDVFASNEFFFENGQIGYMGGQHHADGTRSRQKLAPDSAEHAPTIFGLKDIVCEECTAEEESGLELRDHADRRGADICGKPQAIDRAMMDSVQQMGRANDLVNEWEASKGALGFNVTELWNMDSWPPPDILAMLMIIKVGMTNLT